MPSFAGVDFLDFDSLLNDEEILVRQTARQFVDNEILPIIEKHNREATFPMNLVPQLGELGFFGANLTGYGCAGMSNVAYGLVMQELERGDSGLRSFVCVQSALVMYPIHAFGSPRKKKNGCRSCKDGKAIGCFGLDRAAIRLESRRHVDARRRRGDQLRPERRKNVDHQRLDSPMSRSSGPSAKTKKFAAFWWKKGTKGFKAWDVHGKLSLRASVTSGLSHDGLRNPRGKSAARRRGLRGPLSCLTAGALRHRLGRHRRGHGLLRHRAAIRQDAQAIRE